jgi:hypothetical protein
MSASPNPLSKFLSKYHLWSLVVFLCLMGVRDAVSYGVWSYYKLRDEIDEEVYVYKEHRAEHKRHYEQVATDDVHHQTGN